MHNQFFFHSSLFNSSFYGWHNVQWNHDLWKIIRRVIRHLSWFYCIFGQAGSLKHLKIPHHAKRKQTRFKLKTVGGGQWFKFNLIHFSNQFWDQIWNQQFFFYSSHISQSEMRFVEHELKMDPASGARCRIGYTSTVFDWA